VSAPHCGRITPGTQHLMLQVMTVEHEGNRLAELIVSNYGPENFVVSEFPFFKINEPPRLFHTYIATPLPHVYDQWPRHCLLCSMRGSLYARRFEAVQCGKWLGQLAKGSASVNQLLCSTLYIPNHILVPTVMRFGVYCHLLQGAQSNCNFFAETTILYDIDSTVHKSSLINGDVEHDARCLLYRVRSERGLQRSLVELLCYYFILLL